VCARCRATGNCTTTGSIRTTSVPRFRRRHHVCRCGRTADRPVCENRAHCRLHQRSAGRLSLIRAGACWRARKICCAPTASCCPSCRRDRSASSLSASRARSCPPAARAAGPRSKRVSAAAQRVLRRLFAPPHRATAAAARVPPATLAAATHSLAGSSSTPRAACEDVAEARAEPRAPPAAPKPASGLRTPNRWQQTTKRE